MKNLNVRCLVMFLSVCILFGALPFTASAEIEIEAPSVILIEAVTGTVLYEKDSEIRRHPASVTKVMTLLLVYEALETGKIKLDEMVNVSENAAGMGGSQIYLEPGELMTVEDMIKSVVICSANDAAVALAEHVAGSESDFVDMMNEKARELGMKNTHFDNTNGLDDTTDTHLTTAKDIAKGYGTRGNIALGFSKTTLTPDLIATISNKNIHSNKGIDYVESNNQFQDFSASYADLTNPKNRDIRNNEVASMITLLEWIHNPGTGSVIEYKQGEAIRKAKTEETDIVKEYIKPLQEGMFEAAKVINEYMKYHPYEAIETKQYVYDLIRKTKTNPSKELIEAYYSMVFNDTFGTAEYVEKDDKLTTMQKLNIFKCRDMLRKETWKEAFIIYNDIEYMNALTGVKGIARKVLGKK